MKTFRNLFSLFFISLFFIATIKAEDRALVVGIDVYGNPNISGTPGAADDARAMQKLLVEKFGFAPRSIKTLIDSQATATNIVQNFQTWLIDGTRPGDRVYFFYAGHGSQAPDDNGDEDDKMDEVITPYDVTYGVVNGIIDLNDERTFIRDDKFNDFIAALSGRRVVLMFDSCHSGTISRSASANASGKNLESRYLRLKPTRSVVDGGYSEVPDKNKPRDMKTISESAIDGNVNGAVILSATSPYQQAYPFVTNEKILRGAFTYIFEDVIRRNDPLTLNELDAELKREMRGYADRQMIGQSTNGEYQVPQVDIISKTNISGKPLFAASSGDEISAAVESALYNPLSPMRVKLALDKRRYKLGEKIRYTVDVSDTSFLYILVFSAQNKAFCIFPTSVGGDSFNKLMKGKHSFPREGYDYETEATEPVGKDVWVALISKKALRLGEKEEYTWDEIFSRINLTELQKAIIDKVSKSRGAGNKVSVALTADDWQADAVVVETVR